MALFSVWRALALSLCASQVWAETVPIPYVHNGSFTPDAILRVTVETMVQSCLTKHNVVVNGTSPGPELRIPEGQTTWVRVFNDMPDQNLTMMLQHWHGLTMDVAPFSDGTPMASQWPIPPNHFFDYEIHPEEGHAGTYFYHSHVGFQAVSALGPLIVAEQGRPPYEYQEEANIIFTDLYNQSDQNIEAGLLASPFVWSGYSQAILVNGNASNVVIANNGTTINCSSPLTTIDLKPSTTYRLRFVGGSAMSLIQLALQEHQNLTLIEADGAYTMPHSVEVLQVGAGQRYSVLLHTKSVEEVQKDCQLGLATYFLQAETDSGTVPVVSYAALNYILPDDPPHQKIYAPATPPLSLPGTLYGFLDYDLAPLQPNYFPDRSRVNRTVFITSEQLFQNSTGIIWAENGTTWETTRPAVPYLVALYENDTNALPDYDAAVANGGYDPKTGAYAAKLGEVIDIVLQNTGSQAVPGFLDVHPFHAHGDHYYNLGSGNGTYNATENDARLNGTSPVLRDTTVLYSYVGVTTEGPGGYMGWRAWRLNVTQPGVWMIHCHVLQHQVMGMQTIWVFGNSTDILTVPSPMLDGYLTYGGTVMGNVSHAPEGVTFHNS
ncbi:MAG: hypothetical protein M1838_004537 [Thelocarpon superellum]|nr:MAG: hypothetical protein M1838_004537 [Thelocarpon superellum]